MILIGQYDSPFVRRVGIALTLYEMPFRHEPWSSFGDADKIKTYNPLTRVPTLVLDDGDVLIESAAILDYLDHLVGPERAMAPQKEPERHRALFIAALATGLCDKLVSLFYEKRLHDVTSELWITRCRTQIGAGLGELEKRRAAIAAPYFGGDKIGHADIAVGAMLRFLNEVHAGLVDMAEFPALAAHSARIEALSAFKTICQPFIPPA